MLLQNVLVPLDGSTLAEGVLQGRTRRLLVREGTRVVLFTVVESARRPEDLRARLDDAHAYLRGVEDRLRAEGVTVTSRVAEGEAATGIARLAAREGFGLVAMATHGRTGVARLVRGSVAERTLRECTVPILLANPRAIAGSGAFERLLVPLDGTDESAQVLPLVEAFARANGAEITLLRVVYPATAVPGDVPVAVVPRIEAETVEAVEATLAQARERLEAAGLTVRVLVRFGVDPADEILGAAGHGTDLLAMATHGRSGVDRLVLGSTTEKVLRHAACPLLLQRIGSPPFQPGPEPAPSAAGP